MIATVHPRPSIPRPSRGEIPYAVRSRCGVKQLTGTAARQLVAVDDGGAALEELM
jgi:hypothetical protein